MSAVGINPSAFGAVGSAKCIWSGVVSGLAYTAAHYTTATNMGLINALFRSLPFCFTADLKRYSKSFCDDRGILSFAGLVYIIGQGNLAGLVQSGGHFGDVLMVVAGILLCLLWGVFEKVAIANSLDVEPLCADLLHFCFTIYLLPISVSIQSIVKMRQVLCQHFPFLSCPFTVDVGHYPFRPNRTSIFMNLMPVFTAVIAYVWLKEAWTVYHTVGGVVIICGILLAQRKTALKTAPLANSMD